ncbi:MAG: diaminopimelate epimerase [Cytophagaceae bacterium]|nr:diaminopimelate epimerase [Cytophagaceae bacterium]|tara:strand:+ start:970 stop:1743 length:774 start_codon:yes stop_codon:yes gene_type:complete
MGIPFYKYQGTGNDFIMIDNRQGIFPKNDTKLVNTMCDRKFGIGADGLILLEDHPVLDFTMVYYNADGNPSSMCGNGGRCIVAFAERLNIIGDDVRFMAVDGEHEARIENDKVFLKMIDVPAVENHGGHLFVNTGSPHHIELVDDLAGFHVRERGAAIRYGALYGTAGSNVNFVEEKTDGFALRTYERGVEDETLSCGTGATAVALAMDSLGKVNGRSVVIYVEGGKIEVGFVKKDSGYEDIYLIGPAEMVYEGVWP